VRLPGPLTRPELRFVWEAVHDRYARQAAGSPARRVTFTGLSHAQQQALADLLGLARLPGHVLTVALEKLDVLLLDSDAAMTAREVAEVVCGPIVNRPDRNRAARREREQLWERLEQATDDRLAGWLRHLRTTGIAVRTAAAAGQPLEQLVGDALAVASRLPADGVALKRLAEQTLRNPHGLDRGQPLRTLILHAALHLAGDPPHLPTTAAAQRAVLDAVGVYHDSVSTDVLVLGLRAAGSTPVDRLVNEAADAGEPLRLTLRALRRAPTLARVVPTVSVCENPSVVEAAADTLGAGCAPLVCTDGMPRTAVLRLLDHARDHGMAIRASADFDAAGVRIVNLLARRVGATAWRFTAEAYRRAVACQGEHHPTHLNGRVPDALVDPKLAAAMREARVVVYEEQQTDLLLADLQ
jgi:uncharacterized protein (TIGR02679 family)